ncbi:MAG: ABC transporter ATP-binding protein [Vicinamibacterales bacterium]
MSPASAVPTPLALAVRGATRRLGPRLVLDGVDLDVAAGALVVVAGPNGAGKSSLVRAIGGRLALDAGTIAMGGLDGAAARRAGRLGLVPQDIALDPHLSVRDNLRLWGALAGAPRGALDDRIARGLAWAGLTDRAGARPDTLSGGMRRRVNLLAALLHEPAVLVLDEPTVGIDREARVYLHGLLADLCGRGTGVLLATHELDDAAAVATSVTVMQRGRPVASGTVDALVARFCAPGGDVVVTTEGASPAGVFEADGFSPEPGGQWVRPEGATSTDLRALHARLAAAGVAVRDVRWRRPSLDAAVQAALARAPMGAS